MIQKWNAWIAWLGRRGRLPVLRCGLNWRGGPYARVHPDRANDSKFGFTLENGEAFCGNPGSAGRPEPVPERTAQPYRSQIFEVEPFLLATEKNPRPDGPGKARAGDGYPGAQPGRRLWDPICAGRSTGADWCVHGKNFPGDRGKMREWGLDTPYIYMEPGRSIVGQAGITLYRVGSVKTTPRRIRKPAILPAHMFL